MARLQVNMYVYSYYVHMYVCNACLAIVLAKKFIIVRLKKNYLSSE